MRFTACVFGSDSRRSALRDCDQTLSLRISRAHVRVGGANALCHQQVLGSSDTAASATQVAGRVGRPSARRIERRAVVPFLLPVAGSTAVRVAALVVAVALSRTVGRRTAASGIEARRTSLALACDVWGASVVCMRAEALGAGPVFHVG